MPVILVRAQVFATTAANGAATLLLVGGIGVFLLLRPRVAFRASFWFTRWLYAEVPSPSRVGLGVTRFIGALLVLLGVSAFVQSL